MVFTEAAQTIERFGVSPINECPLKQRVDVSSEDLMALIMNVDVNQFDVNENVYIASESINAFRSDIGLYDSIMYHVWTHRDFAHYHQRSERIKIVSDCVSALSPWFYTTLFQQIKPVLDEEFTPTSYIDARMAYIFEMQTRIEDAFKEAGYSNKIVYRGELMAPFIGTQYSLMADKDKLADAAVIYQTDMILHKKFDVPHKRTASVVIVAGEEQVTTHTALIYTAHRYGVKTDFTFESTPNLTVSDNVDMMIKALITNDSMINYTARIRWQDIRALSPDIVGELGLTFMTPNTTLYLFPFDDKYLSGLVYGYEKTVTSLKLKDNSELTDINVMRVSTPRI